MFINHEEKQPIQIRQFKTKVNLTINPKIYQAFKEATAKSLQPKSWVIERMMKRYITETNK
tara:strand:+ start:181 stop:363 length:183 start_codon:yes stop_codon:yes gene_type:complete